MLVDQIYVNIGIIVDNDIAKTRRLPQTCGKIFRDDPVLRQNFECFSGILGTFKTVPAD